MIFSSKEYEKDVDTIENHQHPDLFFAGISWKCRPRSKSVNYKIPVIRKKGASIPNFTVILDIDNTLISGSFLIGGGYDFPIFLKYPGYVTTVYIKKRNHLDDFLRNLTKFARVCIYTSSESVYADQIIDQLDPEGVIFEQIKYRTSCIPAKYGLYIKDISIFKTELAHTVLVDDAPYFAYKYPSRTLKIPKFMGENDDFLVTALFYLKKLSQTPDVAKELSNRNKYTFYYLLTS